LNKGTKNYVKKRVGYKSILSLNELMSLRGQARSWVEKHITILNLKFKLQSGLANTDSNKRSKIYKRTHNISRHVNK